MLTTNHGPVIALIPARGASKRIPRKNLAMLGHKTLVEWAIDAALDCPSIDHVIVSTDDYDIAALATRHNVQHVERAHSTDDQPMTEVVRHATANLDFGVIVLLQPTSPFRTAEDIQSALENMNGGDGVISVTERLEHGTHFSVGHANRLRPVDFANNIVRPNGAIFAITKSALDRGYDWWTAPIIYGYAMPNDRSLDIDTVADLELARSRVAANNASPH